MDTTNGISTVTPVTVAFVNCFDASTFGHTVHLTAREEMRLRNVLAAVHDYGFILAPTFQVVTSDYSFSDVIDYLRDTIGTPIADAALAAAERSVPAIEPAPAAVMPVWRFEPDDENEDLLLSSATLWNCNLLLEALRVEDDDDPTPVASVQGRFDRWTAAAGVAGRRLATMRLPGRPGSYVVFATAAPA